MSFVNIWYRRMCLFRYILVCHLASFDSAFFMDKKQKIAVKP